MTYHGQVKNGVVVFKGKPPLKEGTIVLIEPLEPSEFSKPSASGEVSSADTWAGDTAELHRLLAEVQEMRDADLRLHEEDDR